MSRRCHNRSGLRKAGSANKALVAKVQRRFAAGHHIGGRTSANSKGSSVALLIIANAPVQAQTAEEQERSYRLEAMEQALQTKQHFDLYGVHFDSDMATIQPESTSR
jgi:hypothetical protein